MVAVSGYEKKDGTKVGAYSRNAPGASKQLGLLAATVVTVWALSSGGGATEAGSPRPAEKPAGHKTPVFRIVLPTGHPAAPGHHGGQR